MFQILGIWYAMIWWPPSHLNQTDLLDNFSYTITRKDGKDGELLLKFSQQVNNFDFSISQISCFCLRNVQKYCSNGINSRSSCNQPNCSFIITPLLIYCSDIQGTECNAEKEDLNTRKSPGIYNYIGCNFLSIYLNRKSFTCNSKVYSEI